VDKDTAKLEWPVLKNSRNVPAAMKITGTTVFVPNEISSDDWALIVSSLSVT
jgi:hypothetical protein